MKKAARKRATGIFIFALVMMVAVSFMPGGMTEVHGATFSTGAQVTGFKVTGTESNAVTFAWDAYPEASGYEIYKATSKNGSYERIKSTTATGFKRTGLTTGKTCYYKVRAYGKDQNGKTAYSNYSGVISGTPAPINTAGAVADLRVSKYDDHSITLVWGAYSGASGYEVYKATSSTGKYVKIKTVSGTSFKRTGLTTNKTCYYKVRAYRKTSDGKVYYSRFSQVIPGTPVGFSTSGQVSGFKVTGTTYNTVSFQWAAYPKSAGYLIYKATSKNGKYERIKTTSSTKFTRTGLTTNTKCYYKIRAYKKDSKGKTIYSKYSSVITGTPVLKVPVVTVKSASDGITVTWNAVSGAKGYKVYRATSSGGSYTLVKTLTGRSFKNTSISSNKSYYYKVRAYRVVKGKEKLGSCSGAMLGMKCTVAQTTDVTAASESDGVKLGWKAVSGASGYEIYRASGSTNNYTNVGSATGNSFKDKNVANGVTYYYKVRAYKAVGNSRIYGSFSKTGYSRSAVVSTAVAWLGCKESNKSNKPIIDLYNKTMGTNFSYTTPWCAMYVSAVAIKSGTTDIIVRGSYCPTIINTYKNSKTSRYSYGKGAKYTPKPGDVIFFDWNYNGVPDHTGMVASVSGKTVKTIEGNYRDAVGYRTFSVGYKYVLGYGLPNYDDANGIVYTGSSKTAVGCGDLVAAGIGTQPEGYQDLGSEYDFVEQKVESMGCGEDVSGYEMMVYMVKKVRANGQPEDIDCSVSQYYAAFIYKLCQDAGIDASIITAEDAEGNINAWVEVNLDDKWYRVDASKEQNQIEEFVPEATDVEE